VTSDIRAGSKGDLVGTAEFQRMVGPDGTESLSVRLSIPAGIRESHLCISREPYASRVPPGTCPANEQNGEATATYLFPLPASYSGRAAYVQAHAVTAGGETAYAGWQSGSPFYGNVAVPAVGAATEVPVGSLGGLGLALLLGAALLMLRKQRAGVTR
jgi:hypothetical protein